MKNFISLLFALIALPAVAQVNAAHPGGVVQIPFELPKGMKFEASYHGKRVLVMPGASENSWVAVVGIALDAPVQEDFIELKGRFLKMELPFAIKDKEYPLERLNFKSDKHVMLSKADQDRAIRESKKARKIYNQFSPVKIDSVKLKQPVQGRYSAPFGQRRILNGKKKSRHTGLDIAQVKGTPIHAAMAGKVVLAENLFYTGNTVIIDQGQGFKSVYCHMSAMDVTVGDKVSLDQVIGKVGSTGRVTGPHLHWTVVLNGNKVDPTLFL